jgi:glyoxylase-like metal-dependent hydrolase (beta-lactamase superfamily II)
VAAVIDPQRDVDIYLEASARLNAKIKYIIETHVHADFVSGHRELAERTGAHIYMGLGRTRSFFTWRWRTATRSSSATARSGSCTLLDTRWRACAF